MEPRAFLTAAAAVTVTAALAALAAPGTARAAAGAGAAAPVPAVAQLSRVNLHAASERLSGHVAAGPRAGIVPPRGATGTVRNAGAAYPAAGPGSGQAGTCTEPNCDLTWHGGPVQHSPKVYVVFWGPAWNANAGEEQSANYLLNFYRGLGTSSDTWSTITSQYTDGSGRPTFSGPVYQASFIDTSKPPSTVTPGDLAKEAALAAAYFGITSNTDISNAQVVVASQSGTCFSDGFAGTCTPVQNQQYCAWHAATSYGGGNLSFTNLPYLPDAGYSCGEDWINPGSAGTLDGFSTVGGHEFAEAVTDPVPNTGWIDLNDNVSGGEIGDKCAWAGQIWGGSDPAGDITLSTGTFAMQSLWDNASGSCRMSPPAPSTSVSASLSGGGRSGEKISVPTGTAVRGRAWLSGPDAAAATGTVTYDVYSNAACTRRVSASTKRITTAGALPASVAVRLTRGGTYYWKATYSGDARNAGSASACGASGEVEKVTVPAIDRVAGTRHKTSASVLVSTSGTGELLVAYVATKGPGHEAQSASVSARGLKWHLVARSNHGRGDAEIWYARATGKLSGLKVTARDRHPGWPVEITVAAYRNASGIGRHVARHAGKGAPFGSLRTSSASSRVFAVGDDWVRARIVRPVRGQRLIRRTTGSFHGTYWVQAADKVTAKAGKKVTIRDARPTADPYDIVLVEIR